MKSGAKPVYIALATPLLAIALFAFPTSTYGQTTNPGSPNPLPGAGPRTATEHPSIRHREFILRSLEIEAAKPQPTEDTKLIQTQIARDFRQMQVVNNEILSATIPASEPDYSKIARSISEIRECASRLKNNLGLAMVGKDAEKVKRRTASNAKEIKADLLSLDRLIMSFVHNPVFKKLEVLNVEDAAKARSDLEAIVELSRAISKDAQRLKKSEKKSSL